ncbi:MAG: GNAT family N-acetyltransferase [Candidatus Aminicenantes bacterium]|nr:GNAT family N-acetyltransferase [Candidatus Aminicenantes bacterium]MCJ7484614.1 GNAT family N-acetyltransferase [Candidatus Aminicenantes bacterium]TFG56262.1 MAG: GNAT family N-acetyltransferase [Candidatus Aminicenantes bacterium]
MDKTERMKDGTEVMIRRLAPNDIDKLMEFYGSLPEEDRRYLKFDVTDRKVVAKRLRRIENGDDIRVVAVHGGVIVASGALELSGEAWSKHQGEIRVVIARPFQQRGLGTILIRELYFVAVQNQLTTIIARMMRPQTGALKIFRRLGFREESILPDFVKDLGGGSQDLIVMRCEVKDLWKELDRLFSESDWQRCR